MHIYSTLFIVVCCHDI